MEKELEMDPVAQLVNNLLMRFPMAKASRDCFVNFFRILPLLLQKAFTIDVASIGWKVSGLVPFDIEQIFKQCSAWPDCNGDHAKAIIEEVPKLSQQTAEQGICTDEMICAELGEIIGQPERNRDGTVLNNRRTLWLNSDAARKIYQQNQAAKKEKARQAEERRRKLKEKAKGIDTLTLATRAVQEGRIIPLCGANYEFEFCMCARNACMKIRKNNGAGAIDDKWRGCPVGCKRWFCPLKSCMDTLMKNHLPKCVAQTHFEYEDPMENEVGQEVI
jgi:hypothetical protein